MAEDNSDAVARTRQESIEIRREILPRHCQVIRIWSGIGREQMLLE